MTTKTDEADQRYGYYKPFISRLICVASCGPDNMDNIGAVMVLGTDGSNTVILGCHRLKNSIFYSDLSMRKYGSS